MAQKDYSEKPTLNTTKTARAWRAVSGEISGEWLVRSIERDGRRGGARAVVAMVGHGLGDPGNRGSREHDANNDGNDR
jgi:hypothetical protein